MAQTVVSLLADRPEAELRKMLARMREESERLQADLARAQVEVDLIEQALQRQTRRGSQPTRRGETREQVIGAFQAISGTASPAAVIEVLRREGASVGPGAIRNMIRRLVAEGTVERVGEGLYTLASRNGPQLEATSGPTPLHEPTDPLSPETEAQEAT